MSDDEVDAAAVAGWAANAEHAVGMVGIARIEAKLDVALADTRAKMTEHQRRLDGHDRHLDGIDKVLAQLVTQQAVIASRTEDARERSTSWPAVLSAGVAVVVLVLSLGQQLYGA